jgi:hypothetical protein
MQKAACGNASYFLDRPHFLDRPTASLARTATIA